MDNNTNKQPIQLDPSDMEKVYQVRRMSCFMNIQLLKCLYRFYNVNVLDCNI